MTRLVVLGIDGMDPCVFEKIQAQLPHLSAIMKAGSFRHCSSVFPPDSIPAWVTIFTGEYPEQHGWLDNIDYEDLRKGAQVNKLCNLEGRTFWDRLSKAGKRVCVVNPLLAYPVWPVNGIMASGPVFITGQGQIFPPELSAKYRLPELGGMVNLPAENELEGMLEESLRSTRELAQFGLELLDTEPWDLFFLSFFTLDRIQHFFWRFSDPSDPFYPGHSSLEDSITRAYECFDDIVGQFLQRLDGQTGLMVLSDHGHGQRPTMLVNLNEALRQQGLLSTGGGTNNVLSLKKGVEITKNTAIKLVARILGEDWLYRIGRLMPKGMRKSLKKSSYLIDKENSLAWVSDVGGGAAVGGIVINPKISQRSAEYQQVTGRIVESIQKITASDGTPLIRWVKVSEEGSLYPNLIFELDERFSVGRSLFCPILEVSPRHRIVSGGHKKEGVFFAQNCGEASSTVSSLSDISPAILSCVSRR
jgi:predicted AlkP superfamily phosphohydrolase/phosphomutase